MLVQLFLGAVLLVIGTLLHVLALEAIGGRVKRLVETRAITRPLPARVRLGVVVLAALGTFLSQIVQIWVWAFAFLAIGEFDALEPALYFSVVSFTTLGFGDIIVSPDWRLFASFEAAAGLFLFGLSTAFFFEVLRDVWRSRAGGRA